MFLVSPYIPRSFVPQPAGVVFRYITMLTPEDPSFSSAVIAGKPEDGVDLRTLRAIRVLRPLKLVSGVPSKSARAGSRFTHDFPSSSTIFIFSN